jgi:hypothetical protein
MTSIHSNLSSEKFKNMFLQEAYNYDVRVVFPQKKRTEILQVILSSNDKNRVRKENIEKNMI